MPLTSNNNYLIDLLSAGADALSNLYVLTFRGNFLDEVATDLQVRCDGFQQPASTTGSYQIRYLTSFIDKPVTKVNLTRSFSCTFRVDANLNVFKAILNQQGITFNPSKSFTATDIQTLKENDRLFDVTVEVVDEGVTTETITTHPIFSFSHCWISSITPISYNYDNSQPTTVTMTINFLVMNDLMTGVDEVKPLDVQIGQ